MISLVIWNEELMLGVKMMDEHHERLVEILNKCYHAIMLQDHRHELDTIMNELRDYTRYHFDTEEKLMVRLGYRESPAHLQMHKEFVYMISKFQNRSESGESLVAMDVLQYLQQWLVEHIKNTDRAFAAFLKERGEA